MALIRVKINPMKPIHQQIEINWPLKALFHYVSDISNNPAWQHDVEDAEWLTGLRKDPGARFTCKQSAAGQSVTYEITELKPYRKRSVTVLSERLQPTYSIEFEPHGQNTVLKLTIRFSARGVSKLELPSLADKFKHNYDLHKLKYVLENEN